MRRDEGSELLAAYVDGVAELSPEERRAVEARLADDGALRGEAEGTRALLDQLRALPREADAPGAAPDWAALERSILDAVGPEVPRPWWRRLGWRWAMPVGALAAVAAILALVVRAPDRSAEPGTAAVGPAPGARETPAPAPARPDGDEGDAGDAGDTMPLWLDGEGVEVALAAEELLEVPWESDHNLEELLPASDLGWVDELAEEDLDRAEALLRDPELKPPVRRKSS